MRKITDRGYLKLMGQTTFVEMQDAFIVTIGRLVGELLKGYDMFEFDSDILDVEFDPATPDNRQTSLASISLDSVKVKGIPRLNDVRITFAVHTHSINIVLSLVISDNHTDWKRLIDQFYLADAPVTTEQIARDFIEAVIDDINQYKNDHLQSNAAH